MLPVKDRRNPVNSNEAVAKSNQKVLNYQRRLVRSPIKKLNSNETGTKSNQKVEFQRDQCEVQPKPSVVQPKKSAHDNSCAGHDNLSTIRFHYSESYIGFQKIIIFFINTRGFFCPEFGRTMNDVFTFRKTFVNESLDKIHILFIFDITVTTSETVSLPQWFALFPKSSQ